MATHRIPAVIVKVDAGVPLDLVSNQIGSAALPSIGGMLAYILSDGGSDEGGYVAWTVPQNYVGTPQLVVRVILDGAPSNGDDLAFGVRPRAVADNESADGTFDAEQTAQNTDIGGTGSAYSNEDEYEETITLTGTYAAGDSVYAYVFLDASGTTYTGNCLLLTDDRIHFQYADA